MYRLATCFWVNPRTLSPQGLSIAPILDDHNAHRSYNPEGNYLPFVKEFCQ